MAIYTDTSGDDLFDGTEGDDSFTARRRDDTIHGAGGIDLLDVDYAAVQGAAISVIGSVNGSFSGVLRSGSDGNVLDAPTGPPHASLKFSPVGNSATFDGIEQIVFRGGTGADLLTVDAAALATAGTSLSLDGGAGTDVLQLDLSALTGFGLDASSGSFATGALSGANWENYAIKASAGTSRITTGAGNDSVVALSVSGSATTFNGGAGDDSFTSRRGDYIFDHSFTGGAGVDSLDADLSAATRQGARVMNITATEGGGWSASAVGSLANEDGSNAGLQRIVFSGVEKLHLVNSSVRIEGNIDLAPLLADGTSIYFDAGSGLLFEAEKRDSLFLTLTAATTDLNVQVTGADAAIAGLRGEFTGVERYRILLGSGNDTVMADTTNSFQANGGAGNDVLTGGSQAPRDPDTGIARTDSLNGEAGDDLIEGRGGDDFLIGGDGIDTVSYASNGSAVTVVLNATDEYGYAVFQETGAGLDYLSGFENLIGSAYRDTLSGDDGANRIDGGAGDDVLIGHGGDDTLNGEGGDDVLFGLTGADTLNGGDGNDTVSYAGAGGGVSVYLINGEGQGSDAEGDHYSSVENVIGSAYGDVLLGRFDTASVLDGGADDDTLFGAATGTVLIGGAGGDFLDGNGAALGTTATASYVTATAGVVANLANASGNTGDAAGDSYFHIANLIGSAFDDTLTGDAGDNVLTGHAGADRLDGGDGSDTASYADANLAVTASLRAGRGSVGEATGDRYVGVENLTGGVRGDTLVGNGDANVLRGGAGNDVISGYGGADRLFGDDGNDQIIVSANGAAIDGGAGIDRVVLGTGSFVGFRFDDAHFGNVEQVSIKDAAIVDFSGVSGGLTIVLASTFGGGASVIGTAGGDRITGGIGADRISGGAGGDLLFGRGGPDVFAFTSLTDMAGDGVIDRIADFNGDTIDLSRIDADATLEGVQHFTFIGTAAFGSSGDAYEVRVRTGAGGNSYVQFDANHDGAVDATFLVHSAAPLQASDFFLLGNDFPS